MREERNILSKEAKDFLTKIAELKRKIEVSMSVQDQIKQENEFIDKKIQDININLYSYQNKTQKALKSNKSLKNQLEKLVQDYIVYLSNI